MASIQDPSGEAPKWIIAVLAIFFSFGLTGALIQLFAPGLFRHSFGEWRFVYYSSVCSIVSAVLYVGAAQAWRPVPAILVPIVAGYFGSILLLFCLTAPSLLRVVRAGHLEQVFLSLFLPFHIAFVLGAAGAALLMLGFLTISQSWQSSAAP